MLCNDPTYDMSGVGGETGGLPRTRLVRACGVKALGCIRAELSTGITAFVVSKEIQDITHKVLTRDRRGQVS